MTTTPDVKRDGTGKKPPLSFILDFGRALGLVSVVMLRGSRKYLRNNWKGGGPNAEMSVLLDSVLRHLTARQNGEVYDSEMGTDHLANAAAGLLFALYHHGREALPPASVDDKKSGKVTFTPGALNLDMRDMAMFSWLDYIPRPRKSAAKGKPTNKRRKRK